MPVELPIFGIRSLTGTGSRPALISITDREYDTTITSEPSAKLLYLDDDDGELITVGSAWELSQRLQEPTPRYTRTDPRKIKSPLDGRIVHVFDINHTPGSLAVWRDHEAYTSKELSPLYPPRKSAKSPFDDPVDELLGKNVTNVPAHEEALAAITHAADQEPTETLPEPASEEVQLEATRQESRPENVTNEQSRDILNGIEAHLNGLANVLQVAAATLQKAASKTQDNDTSIVEDVLIGVKGILTEVGSFGLEAYKAFEAESNNASHSDSAISSTSSIAGTEGVQNREVPGAVMPEPDHLAVDKEQKSFLESLSKSLSQATQFEDARSLPRVKFAATVEDAQQEPDGAVESPISSPSVVVETSFTDKRKTVHISEDDLQLFPRVSNPSILDDGNEDADFTARYPPLMSVRRAHTVNSSLGREARRGLRELERHGQISKNGFTYRPKSLEKQEYSESAPKPLPGAWPEANGDPTSALPGSRESSGAFFNRMTGRGSDGDFPRLDKSDRGLHRANTTAASNPASRLNGPFDPGFTYHLANSSTADTYHKAPFRPRRPFGSASRARLSQPPWARAPHDDSPPAGFGAWKDYIKDESRTNLRSKRSMPAMHFDGIPSFDVEKNPTTSTSTNKPDGFSKYEFHRGVKHYRSVPSFQISPQVSTSITHNNSTAGPSRIPDLLTGTAPSDATSNSCFFPPPIAPFTTNSTLFSEARPYMRPAPASPTRPDVSPTSLDRPQPGVSILYPNARGYVPYRSSNSSQTSLFNAPPPQSSTNVSSNQAQPPQPPRPRSHLPTNSHTSSARPIHIPAWTISNTQPTLTGQAQPQPKDKIDECVDQLKSLGFGTNDKELANRLHVYALVADGDVTEAVELIEEDRTCSER